MGQRAAWALVVAFVVGVGGYLLFLPQDCTAKTDSKAMDILPEEIYNECETPLGITLKFPFSSWTYPSGEVTTEDSRQWLLVVAAVLGLLSGLGTYLVMWLRSGGVDTLLTESDAGYGRTGETRP